MSTDPIPNEYETSFGIFHLVNPPSAEDAATMQRIVAHVDFDYDVLRGYMDKHYIKAIDVQWVESNSSGNATASWWGTGQIVISQQFTDWRDDLPFVFAHETGHMVDQMVLNEVDHRALTTILHSGPGMPGMMVHSNSGQYYRHPNEDWSDTVDNDYVARLNEDFADQFVAAFAPDLWHGTVTDVPSREHSPRFVHYTDDNAGIKKIVLAAVDRIQSPPAPLPNPTPTPPPSPTPRPVVMTRGKAVDDAISKTLAAQHDLTQWSKGKRNKGNRTKVKAALVALGVAQKALHSIKPYRAS